MKTSVKGNPALQCDTCGSNDFTFLFDHHHSWKVQQCSSCGLVQVLPRPTRKEVAKLYDNDESHFNPYIDQESVHRAYFQQKLATCYSLLTTSFHSSKQHVASSKRHKKITLLDVGCLTGVLLDEAEKMGFDAEGLDISRDAVSYCKKRGLTAYEGTLEKFADKNKNKKYDVITALEIIEHEYSPMSLVSSMYRTLNTNGVAMVTTPNHGSWWRTLMGKTWPGYTHPEHLYFFDPESLKELFRSVGFRDIEVTTGDSRPFPLWFLFQRGADYFPQFAGALRLLSQLTRKLPLQNPINPWDDLLIVARK